MAKRGCSLQLMGSWLRPFLTKKNCNFAKKKNTKFLIGFRFNPKLKVATWFNNQCFPYSREWLIWWLMFLFRRLKWISNVHAFQRWIVLEGERTLFQALCISLMLYSEAEDFFNIESAVNILTGCQDNNNKCPTWARNGHCRGGQWQNYMKTNCKRSCGLCNGEELFLSLWYTFSSVISTVHIFKPLSSSCKTTIIITIIIGIIRSP